MKKVFLVILFFILFLGASLKTALAAASLSLSPTSGSVAVGQNLSVNVVLNTGEDSVSGCDVILTFSPTIIKVKSVSFGSSPLFVDTNATQDNNNGKLIINASTMSSLQAFKGTGTLATITFEAVSTGSSAVSFKCEPQTTANDTNVFNLQAQDIVNCSANIGGSYTVTSSSSSSTTTTGSSTTSSEEDESETTTSTSSQSNTAPTSTPSLPEAGNSSYVVITTLIGLIFIILSFLTRVFLLKI